MSTSEHRLKYRAGILRNSHAATAALESLCERETRLCLAHAVTPLQNTVGQVQKFSKKCQTSPLVILFPTLMLAVFLAFLLLAAVLVVAPVAIRRIIKQDG